MRSLQKIFSLILLTVFFATSLCLAPLTHAAYSPPDGKAFYDLLTKNKSLQDYGKEFCDKRAGDLMNLETWFSGKCGPGIDTLSGEGVGFVDIITLQGIEDLIGPQQRGLIGQLIDLVKQLVNVKNLISANPQQSLPEKLALMRSQSPIDTNSGLLAQTISVSSNLLLSKPASTVDYLAYVSSNLQKHQIVNQTLAAGQGYGFTSLSPILPIWKAFRNISYLLFALVFVLYGIMIMFRIKIDAKTAASIQLAIPKLIATLIMITFSYAIVGLLVDLSTLATGLSVSVLSAGGILNLNWWTGQTLITGAGGTSFLGAVGSLFINSAIAMIMAPFILVSLWAGPWASILGAVVGVAGLSGYGIIIGIIIFIAVLISYFKLILKLFEAFLSIVINLIFSPIILLGNVLPGSNAFSSWLLTIAGNLAVFPTAVFFLTLSYALMVQPFFGTIKSILAYVPGWNDSILQITSNVLGVSQMSVASGIWSPPMTFSIVGGANGDILLAALGFGLLLMASKYVDMVKEALKVPPFKYGAAIGEALKSGYTGLGVTNYENVGNANWYKRVGGLVGAKPGIPWNQPEPTTTPPASK